MSLVLRWLRLLPLLILSPLLIVLAALGLAGADLLSLFRRRRRPSDSMPSTRAASVVIPNWNGRDLLEKYVPSVVEALAGNPDNEIVVVDNGSEDGSAAFVRDNFPQVRLLALDRNLGFGGGSNAGFRAAKNDIVVLLNSDMRVAPDFLQPLLDAFTDERVFAVSCQIFFSDSARKREETGLTQGTWQNGWLRVRHRIDDAVTLPYPCFYGGGGSCAFDRRKFLELGGFDRLLAPFYLEDTDLGYLAWKRGWKVLYQPASRVWHEHRGTIGKRFSAEQIQSVLQKNFLLWVWKNIHEWRRLVSHFAFLWAGATVSFALGDSPDRPNLIGLWRAILQLSGAVRSRMFARSLAVIGDTEAFRRPLGGYFRDRFETFEPEGAATALRVLFVAPYPICPPVHGGGVFMYQTAKALAGHCELHLIVLLDFASEREAHAELARHCGSIEFLVRMEGTSKVLGSITPHAVTEFANEDLRWLIHRQIFTRKIDLVQLEYTNMAQYAEAFRHIPNLLFEHDIYFQSIARGLTHPASHWAKIPAAYEYLRALRWELRSLPRLDRVQVCSADNRRYLESFLPRMTGRIDDGLRAGIDTSRYEFRTEGREPDTMLFLGSFRHLPNQHALNWFTRDVLPLVLEKRPSARLVIVGSDPPPAHSLPHLPGAIELRGFVEDVREPLGRYAVFVCPILSGSGMRVKLLEAFSAGIPVVSTPVGAEGLATRDREICRLAATPHSFAEAILQVLDNPADTAAMSRRARAEVEANRDIAVLTRRLAGSYREAVKTKRGGSPGGSSHLGSKSRRR